MLISGVTGRSYQFFIYPMVAQIEIDIMQVICIRLIVTRTFFSLQQIKPWAKSPKYLGKQSP